MPDRSKAPNQTSGQREPSEEHKQRVHHQDVDRDVATAATEQARAHGNNRLHRGYFRQVRRRKVLGDLPTLRAAQEGRRRRGEGESAAQTPGGVRQAEG